MWNASWIPPLSAATTLDLAVWFAGCAALGAVLAWLRELAPRDHGGPRTPRLAPASGTRATVLAGT